MGSYQQASEETCNDHKLKSDPQSRQTARKSKYRKREITWYNPPWDVHVKNKLGRKFLVIVDKSFPKDH